MARNDPVQYYVEGDDEKKLISVLKTDLRLILPGKVDKFNVVEQRITNARLRTLDPKTTVVLIFDTDTGQKDTLEQNIQMLLDHPRVAQVITIPQVMNLEDELVRCCDIKDARALLGCRSMGDFKSEFIHVSNLKDKLLQHGFRFDLLWSQPPAGTYLGIQNGADKIRV